MKIAERLYLVGSEQFGISHPLDCNCYLLDSGQTRTLLDTGLGLGVEDILQNIRNLGFAPESIHHIVITHSHIGHWGGANELRERTGAVVWAPAGAEKAMQDVNSDRAVRLNFEFGRYPAGFVAHPCRPDKLFSDTEKIALDGISLRAIRTGGHTPDSTCLLFENTEWRGLFTGDVLFYGGRLGLTNLEGCSLDEYRRNIHKIANLRTDALFPGHGVFVLRRGEKHIQRAVHKLADLLMPPTFFEENELIWDREYLSMFNADMTGGMSTRETVDADR
jgi:glyoxylase-like metal-dependent hydrolase (beta-lactamase superfamily II)